MGGALGLRELWAESGLGVSGVWGVLGVGIAGVFIFGGRRGDWALGYNSTKF